MPPDRHWRTHLADPEATAAFGARLGALGGVAGGVAGGGAGGGAGEDGDDGVVYLHGDLGAGKTTLVRGFLRAAGHSGPVRSPTYTLMEPYEIGALRVRHFDLYRLADPDEFEEMGGRDEFEGRGWRFVEWPERGAPWLPAPDLHVELEIEDAGRRLVVRAGTERGRRWLEALEDGDRRESRS